MFILWLQFLKQKNLQSEKEAKICNILLIAKVIRQLSNWNETDDWAELILKRTNK